MRGQRTALESESRRALEPPQPDQDMALSHIVNAEIHGDKLYLIMDDGTVVSKPLTSEAKEIYWAVKIRNRRKAFGL